MEESHVNQSDFSGVFSSQFNNKIDDKLSGASTEMPPETLFNVQQEQEEDSNRDENEMEQ